MGGQMQKGLCSAQEVVPHPQAQQGATVLNVALYVLNTVLQGGDKVSTAEQYCLHPLHPLPAITYLSHLPWGSHAKPPAPLRNMPVGKCNSVSHWYLPTTLVAKEACGGFMQGPLSHILGQIWRCWEWESTCQAPAPGQAGVMGLGETNCSSLGKTK